MTRRRLETEGNREGRDQLGRFVPGCAPGPGRPEGSTDLRTIARRWAESKGTTLEAELAQVIEATMAQAQDGDLRAAMLVFRHLADESEAGRGKSLEELLAETVRSGELEARVRSFLSNDETRRELDRQRPMLVVETGLPVVDHGGRQ